VTLGGVSPVLTKYLLATMPMESLLAWRYGLALAALVPAWACWTRQRRGLGLPAARKGWAYGRLVASGILGSGVGAFLFTASLQHVPAAVSHGLSKSGVLLVAFVVYVLAQEPVSLGTVGLVGALVMAAGLLSAGEAGWRAGAGAWQAGVLLAGGAGLVRAFGELAGQGALQVWPPLVVVGARLLAGAALALVVAAVRPGAQVAVPATWKDWLVLLALAWLGTALPLLVSYQALGRLPWRVWAAVRSAAPSLTALLAWVGLGETLRVWQVLGLVALLLVAYAMACAPGLGKRPMRAAGLSRPLLRFVALMVGGVVLLTGLLQAWQLALLLRKQIDATLGRSAALIGELLTLHPRLPLPLLRAYLARLAEEEISTPGYTAAFVYLVATDARGMVMGWGFRPQEPWPPLAASELARLLACQGPAAAGRKDLLSVHVAVTAQGTRVAELYVGYRASIRWAPLVAVVGRSAVLAAVMALVAAASAASLVRGALGAVAVAAARLRAGSEGARHRASSPALPAEAQLVAEWLAGRVVVLPREPWDGVKACAYLGGLAPAQLSLCAAAALSSARQLEGTVAGAVDGWLVCGWGRLGGEVDDPLRAYLWVLSLPAPVSLLAGAEDSWDELQGKLAPLGALLPAESDAQRERQIFATPAFAQAAHRLLCELTPTGLYLVKGQSP
jgi:drug/metabolite transporter (DMT)-like permease